MSIVNIAVIEVGEVGVKPREIKVECTNTLSQVTTENFITPYAANTSFGPTDYFTVAYGTDSSSQATFKPTFSNGLMTLVPLVNPANVTLPVVDGNFSSFDGTTGKIKDDGFLPSDATKTKVVMAGSAVTIGNIATYSDVNGSIDNAAGTAVQNGPIQAGLSGTSGYLASFPATASKGSFRFVATANTNDDVNTFTNAATAQATTWTVGDPGGAASKILQAPNALASGNIIVSSGTAGVTADSTIPASSTGIAFTNAQSISFGAVTMGQLLYSSTIQLTSASMAAGAVQAIITATAGQRFKVRDIILSGAGTAFSGGGGDRTVAIFDATGGTVTYTVLTAALLGTPVATRWGGTGMPFPTTASWMNTATTAGGNLSCKYVGGTADYLGGGLEIIITLEKVA
jgi:hypothetical protein